MEGGVGEMLVVVGNIGMRCWMSEVEEGLV